MDAAADSRDARSLFQRWLTQWRARFDSWVLRRIPPARNVVLGHQNIFIMPNKQGLGFLFVLGLMFIGAVNYEASLGFALVFLLLSMFVLSIFYTFRNLAGLHVSAVMKDPRTYEHVPPETVGNKRQILISDQAGRSNLLVRLNEAGIPYDAEDSRLNLLLEDVKQREAEGYSYDGAEASFELLVRKEIGRYRKFFELDHYRVIVLKMNTAAAVALGERPSARQSCR